MTMKNRKVYVIYDGHFPCENLVSGYYTNKVDAQEACDKLNKERSDIYVYRVETIVNELVQPKIRKE